MLLITNLKFRLLISYLKTKLVKENGIYEVYCRPSMSCTFSIKYDEIHLMARRLINFFFYSHYGYEA